MSTVRGEVERVADECKFWLEPLSLAGNQ